MTGGIRMKASTNRVRTSIALQQTSIWTNTIGQEGQQGSNAAVEAHINAPTQGQGGGSRSARRTAAAQAVMQTGAFDTNVTSYESLLTIARNQGAVGGANRGACKVCGQLGHLTKQCRNFLSAHFKKDQPGAGGADLLVPPQEQLGSSDTDLSDLSSDLSSSSSDDEKRRRSSDKKSKKRKREKSKSSQDKKRKSKSSSKHKSREHKKKHKSA